MQQDLCGESTLYKMDLLHEGGNPGDVPVGAAARAVEKALRTAHPDATWAILGWQENPRREIVDAVDRDRMLVLDGISDHYPNVTDREADWAAPPTPSAPSGTSAATPRSAPTPPTGPSSTTAGGRRRAAPSPASP
ncbi:hypothetical protein GCM10020000_47540 [Streptomyces olivoverticillatus]